MSRATIHRWLKRDDLAPTVVPRRPWKLDWAALAADVAAHPDDRLIDRAQRFGVQVSTISYALAQMGITRKKQMRYQERCEEERQAYQQQLDTWVESHGEETVVSILVKRAVSDFAIVTKDRLSSKKVELLCSEDHVFSRSYTQKNSV
ncbi:IS630 transposase-related protein [Thermosynechococcus sp. B0]|nr:IS630 transposase-related protein [Thermosynechococcus sp. B0]